MFNLTLRKLFNPFTNWKQLPSIKSAAFVYQMIDTPRDLDFATKYKIPVDSFKDIHQSAMFRQIYLI